ncbi:MAG: ABC transporter permease [Pseudomonadota bacterium]
MDIAQAMILTIIAASTPILLASIGELVVERSGVLNLGVEGMMIIGAVCAFASSYITGSAYIGVLAGMFAGVLLSAAFALLTQKFLANQVASGLALTLLGLGISGQIGSDFTGLPGVKLEAIYIPTLSDIPLLGAIIFGQDILVYLSFILIAGVGYVLFKTRLGLIIRAVGDNPVSAHALGYNVVFVRICCILFGGACAGLSGAYLSLVYTPQWVEDMSAGRGWIALALVVFATWLPKRLLIGAYLFGLVWVLGLYVQVWGSGIAPQFLAALPYLVTILALVIISRDRVLSKTHTPASIGQIFVPDR